MKFITTAFEQLENRGFVFQATHIDELKRVLSKQPVTFYIGIDPTADDLHIGHFFGLQMARILQDCGHKCIVLVGGATALIGDPSGKKDMRKMLTAEEVAHNASEIKGLLQRFVRLDGDNPAIIVDNADWLGQATYINFLRDVGVHFNINEMLSKDLYKSRLKQGGLTFMEMGYMLMQAYDFVYLNDKYNCILEIGGSDQWGNIVAGTDLSRKMNFKDGTPRPTMMGLTCPLLTNADGVKMGKTEKGTLWVSRDKTSAFDFFQHFVNCYDADVERLLRFFTKIDVSKIKQMCKEDIVKAKKLMAFEVTKLVHGEEEALNAQNMSNNLFASNSIDKDNAPTAEIKMETETIGVLDLLLNAKFVASKGEARRLIEQNGLSADGNPITDPTLQIEKSKLKNGLLFKKGKKNYLLIKTK